MKNEKYKAMYKYYTKGYSCEQIGKMFGLSRSAVWCGFKRKNRQYKLRFPKKLPFIIFKETRFTLKPNGYYVSTGGKRIRLSNFIWKMHYGKIPKGYHIHHRNRNKADNRIKNLECLSNSDHIKKYHNKIWEKRKRNNNGTFV